MQLEIGAVNPHAVICKACPGYCCYRFVIRLPVKRGKVDWDNLLRNKPDDTFDITFAKKNFKKTYSRGTGITGLRDVIFTCKLFDKEKNICTSYADRPTLCQRYVCDSANEGKLPTGKNFPMQSDAARREKVCSLI